MKSCVVMQNVLTKYPSGLHCHKCGKRLEIGEVYYGSMGGSKTNRFCGDCYSKLYY